MDERYDRPKLEAISCPVCGTLNLRKDGLDYLCPCCGARLVVSHEDSRLNLEPFLHLSAAEEELRLSPPRFENAQDRFDALIKRYPDWFAPYWGYLRADIGIKYETDTSGKAVPSCYKDEYRDFTNDAYFKKAIELADSSTKNKLLQEAERIKVTWQQWEKEARNLDYDIFLSFKATDEEGNPTEDARLMSDLYGFLSGPGRGYRVFYAPVTMRGFAGVPYYDAYILNALDKSKALIVYGSKPEYFKSTWVENEWMRYLRLIEKGKKNPRSLIAIYKGFQPKGNLPRRLEYRQLYDGASPTFFGDILSLIEAILKESKGSAIEKVVVTALGQGKKKTAVTHSEVALVKTGTASVRKKAFAGGSDVKAKELEDDSAGIYTPTIVDRLKAARICLKDNQFPEALGLYEDCLQEDSANGQALIGRFCAQVKDYRLFTAFTDSKSSLDFAINENEMSLICARLEDLPKLIECADNKSSATRVLEVVDGLFLQALLDQRLSSALENATKIYKILLAYHSDVKRSARNRVLTHLSDIFSINSISFDTFVEETLNSFTDHELNEYLSTLDAVIDVCAKASDIVSTLKWCRKKLEVKENDLSALLLTVYLQCSVWDEKGFIEIQTKRNVSQAVIELVEKHVSYLSKKDAEALFGILVNAESACLRAGVPEYAQPYYMFLQQFDFSTRAQFIDDHRKYLGLIVDKSLLDFADHILDNLSDRNPDTHIDALLLIGDSLREKGDFQTAKKYYSRIFAIQENNFAAHRGIFLCNISFNGSDYSSLSLAALKKEALEEVLRYAPNTTEQYQFVTFLIDICLKSLRCDKNLDDPYFMTYLKDSFNLLFRYDGSTSENQSVLLGEIAKGFLAGKQFDIALEFAQCSLALESRHNHRVAYVLLMCKLKCANESEFIRCSQFSREMEEYKNLLIASSDDEEMVHEYSSLAAKNDAYRANLIEDEKRSLKAKEMNTKYLAERKQAELASREAIRRNNWKTIGLATGPFMLILFGVGIMTGLIIAGGKNLEKNIGVALLLPLVSIASFVGGLILLLRTINLNWQKMPPKVKWESDDAQTLKKNQNLTDDYRVLAIQGDKDAQRKLGECYEEGKGVPQDIQQAFSWYKAAGEQGDAISLRKLGYFYYEGKVVPKDMDKSFKCYEKAAISGDAESQNWMGYFYDHGYVVVKDQTKAAEWFQKAAEQGHVLAQRNLAMYYRRPGVALNLSKAIYWYQKAATQGDLVSQKKLADLYFSKKDFAEAVYWFEKAALQGDPYSQYRIGLCHVAGNGVPKSYELAHTCFLRAAQKGYADAQHALGLQYEGGLGVDKNLYEAKKWLQMAVKNGSKDTKDDLARVERQLRWQR